MNRPARATAGMAIIAALGAATCAAMNDDAYAALQTSGEVQRDVTTPGVAAPSPDLTDPLADVRLAVAQVADGPTPREERIAAREVRIAAEQRQARLNTVASRARERNATRQERIAEQIAARKAAEEQARREKAEKAQREKAEKARKGEPSKPKDTPSVSLPITSDYRITARYGQSGRNWSSTHTGLDFAAPTGTKVRAVAAGTVVEAAYAGAYGNRIVVDHGDGLTSSYSHLSAYLVTDGSSVDVGEPIGRVGTTGNSTGPHLHLEVRRDGTPTDPEQWLKKRGITP